MFRYNEKIEGERNSNKENHCQATATKYELRALVQSGLAIDPIGNVPLSTSPLVRGAKGTWIFAIREGVLRVAPDGGKRGDMTKAKHETLFENLDVDGAGEVQFKNGIVTDLNDISGTYQTGNFLPTFRAVLRDLLMKASIRLAPSVVTMLEERT